MWIAVLDFRCVPHYARSVGVVSDDIGVVEDVRGARTTSTGVHATLRILDLLAARGPLPLAELARDLGIAKSTIHRICSVLVEQGWAVRPSRR